MRTAPALLICLVAVLALNGCVPDDGPIVVDPEPSSSSSPIFESDEEALAAAEEAYGAYVALSDQILVEGGDDPGRISALVSDELLPDVLEGFELYSENGWHTSGPSTFDSVELQQRESISDRLVAVVIYVCADVTGVRLLDSEGVDVTPPGRSDRLPLEVALEFTDSRSALITGSEVWSGEDFCE